MPAKKFPLSGVQVHRLTKRGTHFVGDVPGLALQVLPSGSRSWVLRYCMKGRRREMGLGGYPEVTMKSAKQRARDARDLIWRGLDPIEHKQGIANSHR